ncbi:hypothetical protein GBA52_019314 [Prunus armeniaca]|nr:hypothetical protein GBA52_019314 [Prunus armeniaca]
MGSSSMTDSGSSSSSSPPNSSTESLNGLKFGRKIYFEDAGLGAPYKSGSAGSSSSGATPPKKQRGVNLAQPGQPPRCQVEGCQVDLSDAKAYYSRHKVCGLHSKTPMVIVAGLEQRFCQQCSRFHQLPEFDQGKRSCRRRLAGHNERRRKPQPGSILSARFGRLSSSIYENSSRVGSFLMDFTAYPRVSGRDAWATTRTSERVPGNQNSNDTGKFLQHPWQSNSEITPSGLYLQGSAGGTSYPGPGIPPGECVTGVTDSSCALSLLSSQPWGSRNRVSGVGMNTVINTQGPPVGQPITHAGTSNHFPTTSWGFKGNAGSSSHEMLPDLGLGQLSQPPLSTQYSGVLELSQQSSRRQQQMELGHTRGYDTSSELSTENCHRSRSRESTYSMSQIRNRKGKKKNTKKKTTRMDEENGKRTARQTEVNDNQLFNGPEIHRVPSLRRGARPLQRRRFCNLISLKENVSSGTCEAVLICVDVGSSYSTKLSATYTSRNPLSLLHNLSSPALSLYDASSKLEPVRVSMVFRDLSYNNFTGDPNSFKSLANLTGLFLQNNKFSRSVAYLVELPLTNLNIENNDHHINFSNVFQEEHKILASNKGKRKLTDEEELGPQTQRFTNASKDLDERFEKGGFMKQVEWQVVEGKDMNELNKKVNKLERRKKRPSPPMKKGVQLLCQQPDEDFKDPDPDPDPDSKMDLFLT